MTDTAYTPNGQHPSPPAVTTPIGPVSAAEAEHVLAGMFALERDYFMSLLAEIRLGRPLDLGAVAKARKTLASAARPPDPGQ
jgi:hypothetical protein